MKLKPILLLMAMAFLWPTVRAQAAITCTSITSPGFSTAYSGTAPNITQSSFTVTCVRALAGDPLTLTYQVSVNNGINSGGANPNVAVSGASTINYDTYQDSGCTLLWGNTPSRITATMTLVGFTPTSQTTYFWGCILTAGQGGAVAGPYTDRLTMRVRCCGNPQVLAPVSITYSASCSLTTPPGNVAFTYTSFQIALAVANTTFGVTCTSLLPYIMALDATAGTLPATGLAYTLALSAASSTGTGAAQSFTINGSMAAGQGGTCAVGPCADTQARTLTITY